MYVSPNVVAKGAPKRLLSTLETRAAEHGAILVTLETGPYQLKRWTCMKPVATSVAARSASTPMIH